jgi:pantetheine-phosphate adenylyltransferase
MTYTKDLSDRKVIVTRNTWPIWVDESLEGNKFSDKKIGDLRKCYEEEHRFYHSCSHIWDLAVMILNSDLSPEDKEILYIAAAYHDIVYDPKARGLSNEEESLKRFLEDVKGTCLENEPELIELISKIIEATAEREPPSKAGLVRSFWEFDNSILKAGFKNLMEYEEKIFKEFQSHSYKDYISGRTHFLRKENIRTGNEALLCLADYVESRKPRIGLYPGSFSPFHIGHKNILEKAEGMFDKVVIVKGYNPEKDKLVYNLPKSIQNREIFYWGGLTTDLIKDLSGIYDVTLIRGLRNGKDLDYEVNQLRFMEKMLPEIKVCYIQCDKEFEHVSSSAIKNIAKFSEDESKKYLLK